jgi:hypothetical protein
MFKLKKIISEQTDIEKIWAKQDAQNAAALDRQNQYINKDSDRLGSTGEFQPANPTSSGTSKSNTDKDQVKKIFDASRSMPSTAQDWEQIKPIAEAMHAALSGLGSGDFLEQLKKIQTQAQLSALIKNWVYDGQTLFEWLEEEYTLSWKSILDIIKPIQSRVGKYSYGFFDKLYESLKNKGWKLETSENSLDSLYMYYGNWTYRRNSKYVLFGNSKMGKLEFTIDNYNKLTELNFITLEAIQLTYKIDAPIKRFALKLDGTMSYWLRIITNKTYVYFLNLEYSDIIEKHFDKILNKNIYGGARSWWIKKFNSSSFKKIFQQVNFPSKAKDYKVYKPKVDKIIEKYKNIIKTTSINSLYEINAPYGGYYRPGLANIKIVINFLKEEIAWYIYKYEPTNLSTVFSSDACAKEIQSMISTTVHELQHACWDYFPMNPKRNWQSIQPYSTNTGDVPDRLWYQIFGATSDAKAPDSKQIELISKNYTIDKTILESWSDAANNPSEYEKGFLQQYYACDINEHQSRLTQFKHANNLDTADMITKKHMITAILFGPALLWNDDKYRYWYYVLICWARNNMTDIDQYIDWLNRKLIVKNQKQKTKPDSRIDNTQTA